MTRLSNSFETPAFRLALLVVLLAIAIIGAAIAWVADGPLLAIVAFGVLGLIILLAKVLMETITRLRPLEHGAAAASSRIEVLESAGEAQDSLNEAVLNDISGLTVATGSQEEFNEAVLQRVRTVEAAKTRQLGFNEGVLSRVRLVEEAKTSQEGFNHAVVNRVRLVEEAKADQAGFNDAIVNRVRTVEMQRTELLKDLEALRKELEALLKELEALQQVRDNRVRDQHELRLAAAVQRLRSLISD